MGKRIVNYYTFAENDYYYLKDCIEEKKISNAMRSLAQNICERYLKSVIEKKATELNDTDIMRTHSLKRLSKFVKNNIPDFQCDWNKVLSADGYYFSARYPGEDSFFVDEEDINICYEAIVETKQSVDNYMAENQKENFDDVISHLSNNMPNKSEN